MTRSLRKWTPKFPNKAEGKEWLEDSGMMLKSEHGRCDLDRFHSLKHHLRVRLV